MLFSIITPTFKRPEKLRRAVESVRSQSFTNWEMIIINDNPGDNATSPITALPDARIKILQNETNAGVNYSRNRGLEAAAPDSDYIIFLDDDDYLAPDALAELNSIIQKTAAPWIVTARGTDTQSPTTKAPKNKHYYSYTWAYLITRRFKGDATHCIKRSWLNNHNHPLRFPTHIKQAEEWLFYSELGTHTSFYYDKTVTTLTEDYTLTGLNLRRRGTVEQLRFLPTIIREARGRNLYFTLSFWLYVKIRFIRAFIK